MERSLDKLIKFTPLSMTEKSLFLSNTEDEILEYDFASTEITIKYFDFFFHCNLFKVTQEQDENKVHSQFSNDSGITHSLLRTPGFINGFSITYGSSNVKVSFHFDECLNSLLLTWKPDDNSKLVYSEEETTDENGLITFEDKFIINMTSNVCSVLKSNVKLGIDKILCISNRGVLFSKESKKGNDVYWVSIEFDEPVLINHSRENILTATFNTQKDEIVLTEVFEGQQRVLFFDTSERSIRDGMSQLFGTVTPLIFAGKVFLYVTGSSEGIHIRDSTSEIAKICGPFGDFKRKYSENSGVKVTSLISIVNPVLDLLFFHGGPESCEWDNPRLPGLLRTAAKLGINTHIINYLGSAGFGKDFRTLADKNTINGCIPFIIDWINKHLPEAKLVLSGGSFGGALAIEILDKQAEISARIAGCILTNSLLDLSFHINRVIEEAGNIDFFNNKFSEDDARMISTSRYKSILNNSSTDILFILGRRDEILTVRPALKIIRGLEKVSHINFSIDDGGHGSLSHFYSREDKMILFIKKLVEYNKV